MALIRSLNLNEKIISKDEEEKFQRRRVKFGLTFTKMHEIFVEKVLRILQMGLYQRAFKLPLLSTGRESVIPDSIKDILGLLKGIFFTCIFNDPLVRYSVKAYLGYIESLKSVNRSFTLDMVKGTYDDVLKI